MASETHVSNRTLVETPRLFPLIRHFSRRVTPLLLRWPISATQITLVGTAFGLAAACCVWIGGPIASLVGAYLFFVCYVLDNCDGEVARARKTASIRGERIDHLGDWLVHAAFFLALGASHARQSGEEIWVWAGAMAALGGTLNFLICSLREGDTEERVATPAALPGRPDWRRTAIYGLRTLAKADFCFLVLLLALLDQLWLLLPAAAIGAQVFWMTAFHRDAPKFHV